jgi:hypothetical protein
MIFKVNYTAQFRARPLALLEAEGERTTSFRIVGNRAPISRKQQP